MTLLEAAKSALERSSTEGKTASVGSLNDLNAKLGGLIPNWYFELITTLPICNLELGWQRSEPEDDFDGIEGVQILDVDLLDEINCDSYPGIYLTPARYLVIGYGSSWAGNCFVIPTDQGEDPPLYEVWHDVAQNTEDLIRAIQSGQCSKVAERLSEFMNTAKIA